MKDGCDPTPRRETRSRACQKWTQNSHTSGIPPNLAMLRTGVPVHGPPHELWSCVRAKRRSRGGTKCPSPEGSNAQGSILQRLRAKKQLCTRGAHRCHARRPRQGTAGAAPQERALRQAKAPPPTKAHATAPPHRETDPTWTQNAASDGACAHEIAQKRA